jgi:hypothetical protein
MQRSTKDNQHPAPRTHQQNKTAVAKLVSYESNVCTVHFDQSQPFIQLCAAIVLAKRGKTATLNPISWEKNKQVASQVTYSRQSASNTCPALQAAVAMNSCGHQHAHHSSQHLLIGCSQSHNTVLCMLSNQSSRVPACN